MKNHNPDPKAASALRRRAAAGHRRSAGAAAAKTAPQPFSADELRRISREISAAWFAPPAASRLTLLEIDPWRVHAYWNIADADLEAARAALPEHGRDAALVLRFTDVSPGPAEMAAPHGRFDIEVERANNNWYVDLWRDAKRYSAELGLRAADGGFVALARSNEVETPRAGPSPELNFRQMEVRAPRAVAPDAGGGGAELSEQLLKDLYPQRFLSEEGFPLAMAETAASPLQEPAFPSLDEDSEVSDGPFPGPAAEDAPWHAGGGVAETGFPVIASAEIDPYRAQARRAKARVLAGLKTSLPPPAAEIVAPTDVELMPQPLPIRLGGEAAPAREETPPGHAHAVAASAGSMPVPLEAILTGAVFSYAQDAPAVQAGAEIVIQGRGAPDSRFMLFGDQVPTAADGGFTVRLPLQRGPELAALLHRLGERHGNKG